MIYVKARLTHEQFVLMYIQRPKKSGAASHSAEKNDCKQTVSMTE